MQAKELLEKYKAGQCTSEEKAIVETWYLSLDQEHGTALSQEALEAATARIGNRLPLIQAPAQTTRLWPKITAAASVVLILASGLYFYQSGRTLPAKQHTIQAKTKTTKNDILPGRNRATLTLADGKEINLDDAGAGELAEEAGIKITKTTDGQLVYTVPAQKQGIGTTESPINTITTPKGGQYQVNLPDGTHVWLNAASSLKYPAVFGDTERKVTLSGEAYFEVAKTIPAKSFQVYTDKQQITVLGTHFNVNAYTDEKDIKTTLLEGAVQVKSLTSAVPEMILKPGQQSSLESGYLKLNLVNTEDVVAWKNGMFRFKDADLQTVMRSISRWYDVTVEYEGKLPGKTFTGEIHRNINLSAVLDILSFYHVRFRTEGKRIIVTS